jgi:anthranilate synthase/aminodeoxychorismate synthase-like glutamine amidotransferase
MFLLIDNYDSFTYNLVQTFQQLGQEPVVVRNSDPQLLRLAKGQDLEAVVISPGPGRPENAGLCPDFLHCLSPEVPLLGVCLGHQLLAVHAGFRVVRAQRIMHGKTSSVVHNGSSIFAGIPQPFKAVRYHSLIMEPEPETPSARVEITARTEEGEPMGLEYLNRPWTGIQFHPESIMTLEGPRILTNFVNSWSAAPADIPDQGQALSVSSDHQSFMQM